MAQVGVEPTASLVLSQGGLPVAYRAVFSFSAQNRSRTCKRLGLSQAALPLAYLGASGPGWNRTIVSWMWAKCRCRWTTGPGCSSVDPPGVAPGSPACDTGISLLGDEPMVSEAEAVGLEPTSDYVATCFQDRLLIQPDDFRCE